MKTTRTIPAAAECWGSPKGGWSRASKRSDKSRDEEGDAVALDVVGACAAVPCLGGVKARKEGRERRKAVSER